MNEPVFQSTKMLQYDFQERIAHWNMNRPHYHNGYELYMQTEGVREISFKHKQYLLKPGTLYLITPHILHSTKNHTEDGVYSRYILNFSEKIFYSFLGEYEISVLLTELSPFIIQLDDEQTKTIMTHMNNIHDYWNLYRSGISRGEKLTYMEVYRILDHILRFIHSSPNAEKITELSGFANSPIYDVLSHVDYHFNEDLQLRDMIKLSHMSKSSFYREFKQITGDSFNHYLNKFRAIKAHKLIEDVNIPLKKIASSVGFSSTAHMTRIFRQIHGISPSEYRNNLQNVK